MWGNVPRAIFEPYLNAFEKMQKLLNQLNSQTPDAHMQMLSAVGQSGLSGELRDRLLLIDVDTTTGKQYKAFERHCTAFVYDKMLDMPESHRHKATIEMARMFSKVPTTGTGNSKLF